VATDANGVAQFSVSGSAPGSIDVVVNYESQAIDKTTIQVTSSPLTTSKVPGRATIEDCRRWWEASTSWCALHRPMGRRDHVVQYSVSGGSKVDVTRARATSIKVSNLTRGKAYRVAVRALNVNGAGAASATKAIVTRK